MKLGEAFRDLVSSDITWLRDTSNDPEDELTEPEEIAATIATHLGNALREIEMIIGELGGTEEDE